MSKSRAHPALADLDPALAHSMKQNTESGIKHRARAPLEASSSAPLSGSVSIPLLVSSGLSYLSFFKQLHNNSYLTL